MKAGPGVFSAKGTVRRGMPRLLADWEALAERGEPVRELVPEDCLTYAEALESVRTALASVRAVAAELTTIAATGDTMSAGGVIPLCVEDVQRWALLLSAVGGRDDAAQQVEDVAKAIERDTGFKGEGVARAILTTSDGPDAPLRDVEVCAWFEGPEEDVKP
jgi:hypothetical protein